MPKLFIIILLLVSVNIGFAQEPTDGTLYVIPSPITEIIFNGKVGGPFQPSSYIFTLKNTGQSAIDWTATANNSCSLSLTGGNLASLATTTVTISICTSAVELPPGTYTTAVKITNVTNDLGSTIRNVRLNIIENPIVSINDLYTTSLPIKATLNSVKIINYKLYTDNTTKSYIEISDTSTTKTVKCWYWYNKLNFVPVKGSIINVWGKPWISPKIDVEGISLARK